MNSFKKCGMICVDERFFSVAKAELFLMAWWVQ